MRDRGRGSRNRNGAARGDRYERDGGREEQPARERASADAVHPTILPSALESRHEAPAAGADQPWFSSSTPMTIRSSSPVFSSVCGGGPGEYITRGRTKDGSDRLSTITAPSGS